MCSVAARSARDSAACNVRVVRWVDDEHSGWRTRGGRNERDAEIDRDQATDEGEQETEKKREKERKQKEGCVSGRVRSDPKKIKKTTNTRLA